MVWSGVVTGSPSTTCQSAHDREPRCTFTSGSDSRIRRSRSAPRHRHLNPSPYTPGGGVVREQHPGHQPIQGVGSGGGKEPSSGPTLGGVESSILRLNPGTSRTRSV